MPNADVQWVLLGHQSRPEVRYFHHRGTGCLRQQPIEGPAPRACISLVGFATATFRARANVGAHVPHAVSAFPYAPISSASGSRILLRAGAFSTLAHETSGRVSA